MSRDNNNSERPKRPRISTRKSSDDSRASRSGNSSGSKPFKKSFPKAGERNSDHKGSNSKFESKPFKRSGDSGDEDSKSESRAYITNSSEGREKKTFGKPKRGGKNFDTRDKYERGSLKYGRRPSGGDDRNEDKAKSFVQKRRLNKIDKDVHKDTIRLNKYIANSGICSRREADELITQGLVEVNGQVVTEMGYQVQKTDKVVFDGQGITPEKPVYVLLNKPKGYISTTKDDKARKTVMDLVANASPYRLFPVGRLDRSTTGVILLTNDGHMTKKLTHPSFDAKKIYHVTLDKKLTHEDMKLIAEGIRLDEGVAVVDQISFIEGKPKNEIGIEIHIGWNRVIRRIFQRLGYEVEALDRVMFAGLTKKNIKRGHWRILSELEVNNLKML
ncbi:pseudouridine synthase [Chryseobacterium shigense]|uniref:Pseudouridine synthase n=1 Tax=Chryseobacterium shigense TaxID=297244 RepID=A0A841N0I7_9FLAO|nr:pseudouridine synthase [Chryseobacterium shigense]MBB6369927.1 23S rRNA pseudouridine2605 synthase [Chryseobacterium shigense]